MRSRMRAWAISINGNDIKSPSKREIVGEALRDRCFVGKIVFLRAARDPERQVIIFFLALSHPRGEIVDFMCSFGHSFNSSEVALSSSSNFVSDGDPFTVQIDHVGQNLSPIEN